MADPIFHIKDSYYFELPQACWQYDYKSLEEVPEFLRVEASRHHLEPTLEEYSAAMHGKILIPQPFGTLRNFYEKESGFCISRFMILELVAAAILAFVFIRLARKIEDGGPPRGRFVNFFEAVLVFLRDEVVVPTIGKHDAHKFAPLLWTMFFFIWLSNLLGLVPMAGSSTGSWSVTMGLAFVILGTSLGMGMWYLGPIGFLRNFIPDLPMPWWLWPLKIVIIIAIFAIELVGYFIRHAVLSIRLLANMVAGHLVLLAIMGIATEAAANGFARWCLPATLSTLGSIGLAGLEILVAVLQAYVFTFLSALFIGSSIHSHHGDDHGDGHH
jgi:F-type H+-transporting ATPase subunit a